MSVLFQDLHFDRVIKSENADGDNLNDVYTEIFEILDQANRDPSR